MAEAKTVTNRPTSASPEPNCAICLGHCANKCFSDSCMHQFCFNCLLEWSKIKAECPLCKQPFKSIIHNVKSNDEYDEHIVETIPNEDIHIIDEQFLFLPQPTRHQFHFRTTFTVDTRGEHAIQQMLLTHPLTNGGISIGYPGRSMYRRRRDTSATSFRRSIYSRNLWVTSPPDVTGRYRDVSPPFYRSCPGARTRLVPWLNRELNALLYEDTQLIMRLVDIILESLLRYHICSSTFRTILQEYLGNKTDHFVHEFYNFMRSPFDMIGYDRHVIYTERPSSPAPFIDVSDNDTDSDVVIVSATNPNEPVVIDLVNTDSDEPILISEQPAPISHASTENAEARAPILPLKLRLKHKRQRMRNKKHRRRSSSSSSSSNSSSSTSSSSTEASSLQKKRRKLNRLKRKLKRMKRSRENQEVELTEGHSQKPNPNIIQVHSTDSEDVPLSTLAKTKKRKKHSKRKNLFAKRIETTTTTTTSTTPPPIDEQPSCSRVAPVDHVPSAPSTDWPSCSKYEEIPKGLAPGIPSNINVASTSFSNNKIFNDDSDYDGYVPRPTVKSEVHGVKNGESSSAGRLRNLFIKKEQSGDTLFSYFNYNSDTSDC
ncbi:unnamed protein product [Brassicogethes aeneus]|uniref:E3 ubiquitin-protein ligase Topors n=1 Tax=Brassicogethes aeneus TaxID=1431903 RepID=A0A9P0AV34_BRAAE|nr:unnamed protein product [Brassicogethes aeneus]